MIRCRPAGLRRAIGGQGERRRGQHRRAPGAEVLRGELVRGHVFDVVVDVVGAQVPPPVAPFEREELGPAASAALESRDDLDHGRIDDRLDASLPSLRRVVEGDHVAVDVDVALQHRGHAVRSVQLRVVFGPDPEEADVQEPHGARQNPLTRKSLQRKVFGGRGPDPGKRAAEFDHVLELGLVPAFPPPAVVEVLRAAGRVDADRLQVPVVEGTDPDVAPRGRDGQVADPFECLRVAHRTAVRIEILETGAPAPPGEAGHGRIGPAKAWHGKGPVPRGRSARTGRSPEVDRGTESVEWPSSGA